MINALEPDAALPFLQDLADAFGVKFDAVADLLPVVMDGRLYAENGKAVYRLGKPLDFDNGDKLEVVRLREPMASDYVEYSKGMRVTVKDGATELDATMMVRRTIRAVDRLGDVKGGIGVVERMSVKDIRTLGEVCDALGFFE